MFQLPEARDDTRRRSCHYSLAFAFSPIVIGYRSLDTQQIVLSWEDITSPIAVANSVRHSVFCSAETVSWFFERRFRLSPYRRENLPVSFQSELVFVQPMLYKVFQLTKLAFVRPEHSYVVHISRCVFAQTTFTDKPIKRLQNGIRKPLRGIRANQNAIFDDTPNQVKDTSVFEKLPHTVHNNLRLQTVIEVVNIAAELVFRSFRVIIHPPFDCLSCVVRTSFSDTAATVIIHSSHQFRLQNLNERMVNILVRPLRWFTDSAPFPCACVPTLCHVRCFCFKAVNDDFPQFYNTLRFCFLHPSGAGIRAVVCSPMMCAVHFLNGAYQILIGDEFLKEVSYSFHRDSIPPFSITGFPTLPKKCTNLLPKFAYLHQEVSDYLCRDLED